MIAGKLWIDKERALFRMSRRLSQVRAEKERLSFDYVRLQREAMGEGALRTAMLFCWSSSMDMLTALWAVRLTDSS